MSDPVVREILFPTDFSDVAARAGLTAAGFARHFRARLHVLHVVPPVTDPTTAPAALREAVTRLGPGVEPVIASASGIPARQIVKYAERHAIDLIVIGTHGRTGVTRALLGSVAEAVVRRAVCLVLTVPAGGLPAPAAVAAEAAPEACCVVCAQPSSDLVCEPCRARIRGEALERKRAIERAGRVPGA